MRRIQWSLVVAALFSFLVAVTASAQATRTWVSGVGDDANPCSRTAPCKTFAGAISKTASGGEIDVLDPGGFGTVTITKGMTIDGGGFIASVLASAVNGIIINVSSSNDVVTLRNLTINGAGTTPGTNGIRILSNTQPPKAVHVEHCEIFGFSQRGISIENSIGATRLFVDDTIIRNNGNGIVSLPTVAALLTLSNVSIKQNTSIGLEIGSTTLATVTESRFSINGTGVQTDSANTRAVIRNSVFNSNTTGVSVFAGSIVSLTGDTISNSSTGVANGGTTNSLRDNAFFNNTNDVTGAAMVTTLPQ